MKLKGKRSKPKWKYPQTNKERRYNSRWGMKGKKNWRMWCNP